MPKTLRKQKSKKNSKNNIKQSGGKKYKTIWCSQSIVNLPRMDCLKKKCGFDSKKYKDDLKKLAALNKQHDKFVAKTCNIPTNKYGELLPDTPEQWDCNSKERKGKLFNEILNLEKEISTRKCEEKHCKKEGIVEDDCMDLGEEQCRIKYKDLIENIRKTKKRKILPLDVCMRND
jgi:hypothetical protein